MTVHDRLDKEGICCVTLQLPEIYKIGDGGSYIFLQLPTENSNSLDWMKSPWCSGKATRLVNQGSWVRSRASPVLG